MLLADGRDLFKGEDVHLGIADGIAVDGFRLIVDERLEGWGFRHRRSGLRCRVLAGCI